MDKSLLSDALSFEGVYSQLGVDKSEISASQSRFPLVQLSQLEVAAFEFLQKNSKNLLIESTFKSGKSTSLILYLLMAASKAEKEAFGIVPVFFPNKPFLEKFKNQLKMFLPVFEARDILVEECSEISTPLETNCVLLTTVQDFMMLLRKELCSPQLLTGFCADDLDYIASFGLMPNLNRIFSFLKTQRSEIFSEARCVFTLSDSQRLDIKALKTLIGAPFGSIKFSPELEDQVAELDAETSGAGSLAKAIFNQFFYLDSYTSIHSMLFCLARFDLFPSPLLIICKDTNAAYKTMAFLERSGYGKVQIYNPKHPSALKAYRVSLVNCRQYRVLLSTPDLLDDMHRFAERVPQLKGVRSLIFLDFLPEYGQYKNYLTFLQGQQNYTNKSFVQDFNVMLLVNSHESNGALQAETKASLDDFFEAQQADFGRVLFEPSPISKSDVDLFAYRVDNVLAALTPKQVKNIIAVETKRIILKSHKMKEHFKASPKERELVVAKLHELSNEIKKHTVTSPFEIPSYLQPSFLTAPAKNARLTFMKKRAERMKKQIVTKVKGKLPEENPILIDENQLKPLSATKIWKAKHHKISKPSIAARKRAKKGLFV